MDVNAQATLRNTVYIVLLDLIAMPRCAVPLSVTVSTGSLTPQQVIREREPVMLCYAPF